MIFMNSKVSSLISKIQGVQKHHLADQSKNPAANIDTAPGRCTGAMGSTVQEIRVKESGHIFVKKTGSNSI